MIDMIKILLNPLAKGAYFNALIEVAQAELSACFPHISSQVSQEGPLLFLEVDLPKSEAQKLMRLSFAQGLFENAPHHQLIPLTEDGQFALPEALVWGNKYRGKTHELVTQLALNLALAYGEVDSKKPPSVLDPMAGRGTTLMWASRYGLEAYGIEIERDALEHFQRDVKRQTKLHKIKHKEQSGVIGTKKSPIGRFFEFHWSDTNTNARLIVGDSLKADLLTAGKRFSYIVSDLPYGVQFGGSSGQRNPLKTLSDRAQVWADRLLPGGVMVLIFNALQPKRTEIIKIFEDSGLTALSFEAPHRMSESILRDLVLFKRTII